MTANFGNTLKKTLQSLDRQVVERLKNGPRIWASDTYLREFGHFRGCSDEEIEALKGYQGVEFVPERYREFLAVMGHESGRLLFRGRYGNYEALKKLKTIGRDFVSANSDGLKLPQDAFVFLMDQGTEFLFFTTEPRDNDPPVYLYHECDKEFTKIADRLSAWFEAEVARISEIVDKEFQ
jgi:hypothetical protein